MYRSKRLRRRVRTSVAAGIGLGLCNTLFIAAISGLMSARNMMLIALFAIVASLLFSFVFFIAQGGWRHLFNAE